jgi:tetratricopeptide (TPR) repeat protein
MTHSAAAFPFNAAKHRPMPMLRRASHLLTVALCLGFAQPFAALAQTNAAAPLPSAAQEALNKGILAAKVPDYPLAIRFFEEARKLAPQAPVIFMNLGIAESKMPGRELRAIAWFGAYLAASPDAPNAAAVKEQIAVLDVRNQSNVSRLIKAVQDAASQSSGSKKRDGLWDVAELWAKAGDITSALNVAGVQEDEEDRSQARYLISKVQAEDGDITGAQKTADLIQVAWAKGRTQSAIADAQNTSGDIAGAQKTLASALRTVDLIKEKHSKDELRLEIVDVQAKTGDINGAQKTIDLITDATLKSRAQSVVVEARAKIGAVDAPGSSPRSTSDTQPPIQRIPKVFDWLVELGIDYFGNIYSSNLNDPVFLDLAGHLKSLNSSLESKVAGENSQMEIFRRKEAQIIFDDLDATAKQMVKAQNSIHQLLKQQAIR